MKQNKKVMHVFDNWNRIFPILIFLRIHWPECCRIQARANFVSLRVTLKTERKKIFSNTYSDTPLNYISFDETFAQHIIQKMSLNGVLL